MLSGEVNTVSVADHRMSVLQSEESSAEDRERTTRSIIEEYQKSLASQAISMVGRTSAEDVVQETFISMIKGAATFEAGRRLTSWLFAINRNRCIDELRRRGADREVPSDLMAELPDDVVELHSAFPDPHESVTRDESRAKVVSILGELSPLLREALLLSADDHTQSEIAAKLGVPIGTVKARVKRAKDKVRSLELDSDNSLPLEAP